MLALIAYWIASQVTPLLTYFCIFYRPLWKSSRTVKPSSQGSRRFKTDFDSSMNWNSTMCSLWAADPRNPNSLSLHPLKNYHRWGSYLVGSRRGLAWGQSWCSSSFIDRRQRVLVYRFKHWYVGCWEQQLSRIKVYDVSFLIIIIKG